jgi:hypothetical protein
MSPPVYGISNTKLAEATKTQTLLNVVAANWGIVTVALC